MAARELDQKVVHGKPRLQRRFRDEGQQSFAELETLPLQADWSGVLALLCEGGSYRNAVNFRVSV